MHPPAIMFGSEGLNLKEKISSGASSRAWNQSQVEIQCKSVWVPRLGSYEFVKTEEPSLS